MPRYQLDWGLFVRLVFLGLVLSIVGVNGRVKREEEREGAAEYREGVITACLKVRDYYLELGQLAQSQVLSATDRKLAEGGMADAAEILRTTCRGFLPEGDPMQSIRLN